MKRVIEKVKSPMLMHERFLVRVARLELAASWSQTRRPTNWATPGYLLFRFRKKFLPVGKPVVKPSFCGVSVFGRNPQTIRVVSASGHRPSPYPDAVTALTKQARYQLHYTRMFNNYNTPRSILQPQFPQPAAIFEIHQNHTIERFTTLQEFVIIEHHTHERGQNICVCGKSPT